MKNLLLGLLLLVVALAARPGAPTPNQPAAPPADWLAQAQREIAAREYRASHSGSHLQAPNRAHALRTFFEPEGVRVHDRTAPGSPELASLRLAGIGRGEELAAVASGKVSSEGARVEIQRPGLVEWFVNTEEGLEQGFTLAARPTGAGPLVVELAVGPATAKALGDTVVLETPAGRKLAYSKLIVADASGARIAAHFEVPTADRVRLVVDDAGAAYPLVIDPMLTGAFDTLLNSVDANTLFGFSVASAGDVNGDGYADVIVGAYEYDAGETNEGAAFIFLGSPTGIASATSGDAITQLEGNDIDVYLGVSVAGAGDVNGDGYDDVIVGSSFSDGETGEGAAFIFHGHPGGIPDGNPLTANTQLEADEAAAGLGYSVASAGDVNGDGYADVIVGAPQYDAPINGDPVPDTGAAFIFLGGEDGIPDGTPATADTTISGDQTGGSFGASVASAGDVDGDTYADVIVGAWHYTAGQSDESAAFIFHGSENGILDADPTDATSQIESDEAGNGFIAVAGAGDVNGDGYADVIVGFPNYGGAGDAGAAMVFHGSDTGVPNGSPTAGGYVTWIPGDQAAAQLGVSVAGAGDVNGDGYADVVIGAPRFDDPTSEEGAAFVLLGSAGGIGGGAPTLTALSRLEVNHAIAFFGYSVAGAGDVNGDGFSDVIAGAPYAGGSDEGAAYVFHGGAQGIVSGEQSSSAAAQIVGGGYLGWSLAAAGDVNGDGYADVIIGAPGFDAGQSLEGRAFVFHGSAAGIVSGNLASAATQLESNQAGAKFGTSVAGAGDVNADGYDDVIVGAAEFDAGEPNEGASFVFLGSADGVADGDPSTAAAQLESNQANAQLGSSVAGAGDVNGDGYGDVIVGAVFYDAGQTNEGAAFVFLGSDSGVVDGNPSTASSRLESDQVNALLGGYLNLGIGFGPGVGVAGAGDVNGDGYADVIVSATGYNAGQGVREGAAFVFLGSASGIIASGNPATAAAQLESNQADAQFGSGVSGAGDVNGDGYADVIVGAPFYGVGQTYPGAAFVFHGSDAGIADGNPGTASDHLASEVDTSTCYGWGASVDGAGDVNGDGYADVIVGCAPLNTFAGVASVLLGGPSGVAGPAAAQIDNYVSGSIVARAGDVNGDGYADVMLGDWVGDSAYVFYGNANRTGRPVLARQLRGDASGIPVGAWGASQDGDAFEVTVRATHPAGRGRVKLEVEYCPPGEPFGDASCGSQKSAAWTDVTATGGGVSLHHSVGGLTADTLYRWRARVLHAPFAITQAEITAPPEPKHGPWRRVSAQSNEADVRISIETCSDGLDNDGDTLIDYPSDPGCKDPNWQIESAGCSDGLDNDDDSVVDMADSDCGSPWSDNEIHGGGCGLLGIETLPLLAWAVARRRARSSARAS